ncbi:phage tail tape measure protein, partial [Rhodobacter sp. TJ_12]|uniref:phage tail tape measure protein n=1 Tax=Rhodobacter sp. TJ_12 TaxID=2029399 RepID=UPI001CC1026C
ALAGRGANLDVAMAAAEPINRAATAYRASAEDLAAASWAAVDNLKVPANQIATALDMMAQAGKEGAFELKDMATYFPSLGAAYQGLGQSGTGAVADLAAALQVVRKGTGDASTAATNLANVLQKIYAPGTVKKFAEQGVDIFAEMEAAAKRGLTPIEAIAELTNRTLNGDLSKLGNLFEDAQVQAGMRSLIQNMDEYRRIRQEATQASGVVDKDFERRSIEA